MNYAMLANKMTDELRRRLDIIEEMETGYVRIGRKYLAGQDERKSNRGSYCTAPAFDVPGLCTWRPRTMDGRAPFHFSLGYISKAKPKAVIAKAAAETRAAGEKVRKEKSPKPASDFEKYVSREAAEDAIYFEKCASRQAVDEVKNFETYISRQAGDHRTDSKGLVISNINHKKEKRVEYWVAVNRRERTPGDDKFRLRLDILSRLPLADLVAEIGAELIRACEIYSARTKAGLAAEPAMMVERTQYFQIKKALEVRRLWDAKAPAVVISPARAGRVQYRSETEFPSELSGEACARIAKAFAAELTDLGVMFTIAIHEPDEHNDHRNRHLHLIFHDRPAKFLAEHGKWDFDYEVPEKGQRRTHFPEKQNKVRVVTAATDSARDDGEKNFAAILRTRWATLCNEELGRAGLSLRFDPGSYKKMGLDCLPGVHLGSQMTMLELRGVPTEVGIANAEKRWDAKRRFQSANLEAHAAARQDLICRADDAAIRLHIQGAHQDAHSALATRLVRYRALADRLAEQGPAIVKFEQTWEMATSRAEKTLAYAQRLSSAVANDNLSKAQIASRADLYDRADQAVEHLDAVFSAVGGDEALKTVRAAYAQDLEAINRLGREIETLIEHVSVVAVSAQVAPVEAKPAGVSSVPTETQTPTPASPEVTLAGVLKRVHSENMTIVPPDANNKNYRVPGLTKAEVDCLREAGARAQARLAGMYEARQPELSVKVSPESQVVVEIGRERSPADVAPVAVAKPKDDFEKVMADAKARADEQFKTAFAEWLDRMRNLPQPPIDRKAGRVWDFSKASADDKFFGEHCADRAEMKEARQVFQTEVQESIVRQIMKMGPRALNPGTGRLDPQLFSERVREFVLGFAATDKLVGSVVSSRCHVPNYRPAVPTKAPVAVSPIVPAIVTNRAPALPTPTLSPAVQAAWIAQKGLGR